MQISDDRDSIKGFMLGTMIGDAIGLPYEGISRRRLAALLGSKPLRHRLLFRYGLVSDDTEHMLMTVAAWQRSNGDPRAFAKHLARRLRLWMLAIPPATGLATAMACLRLLVGVPPCRSGVRSAGNGPVMRAGVLGLLCRSEEELRAFVRAASRITHTDERAEHGALSIALAARATQNAVDHSSMVSEYFGSIARLLPNGEVRCAIDRARESVERDESTEKYATSIGCECGVTGFVMHTVPVVLHLWMSNPSDYCEGVRRVIGLGGDTDTTAAILGGLLGARVSGAGLPQEWLAGIKDFPVTPALVARTADGVKAGNPADRRRVSLRWAAQIPRNLIFLAVVLVHACRRLAPPYS